MAEAGEFASVVRRLKALADAAPDAFRTIVTMITVTAEGYCLDDEE